MNAFLKGVLDAAVLGAAKTVASTEGSGIDIKQTGIAAGVGAGLAALMYILSHPTTTPEVKAAVSNVMQRALAASSQQSAEAAA